MPDFVRCKTTELAITNKRVTAKFGFISRRTIGIMLLFAVFLPLMCASAQGNQDTFANRDDALKAMTARDPVKRAEAIAWVAEHGDPGDDAALRLRLTDENPFVRRYAEQALWVLWSRSGDEAVDALMEKGAEQMQAQQFKAAIATYSEVIRQKPAFAEGWNKRATVLFLAGELRKSLADCDEVMKRNPNHFGALAGYGQIYFQLEQYEKAIEYWKRALRVNPNMEGVEIGIKNAEEKLEARRRRSAEPRHTPRSAQLPTTRIARPAVARARATDAELHAARS